MTTVPIDTGEPLQQYVERVKKIPFSYLNVHKESKSHKYQHDPIWNQNFVKMQHWISKTSIVYWQC